MSGNHHDAQTSVRVSAVLWPIPSIPAQPPPHPLATACERARTPLLASLAPVLWGDWPRGLFRRSFLGLLRTQTVELTFRSLPSEEDFSSNRDGVQTRAQRAHWRLSWQQRMARNAYPSSAPVLTITIYGRAFCFGPLCGCEPGHRCLTISCPTRLLLLGLFCSRLPLH